MNENTILMNSHLRTPSLQGTKGVGKGGVKDCKRSEHMELAHRETGKNLEKCGFGKIERSSG